MLSPDKPTDIDAQPTDLAYWVKRTCDTRKGRTSYFTYRGVWMAVHPRRAARVHLDGREMFVTPRRTGRYKGQGWLGRLVGDIEAAIDTLQGGGGDERQTDIGDDLRAEIARRKAGGWRAVENREHWFEWLEDSELEQAMGTWLRWSGHVRHQYQVEVRPSLGFHPSSGEFEMAVKTIKAPLDWTTLTHLAAGRRAVCDLMLRTGQPVVLRCPGRHTDKHPSFIIDPTTARGTCASCGHTGPMF